jgi:SAM-dependent methyltransferase
LEQLAKAGLDARVGDVFSLPFEDQSKDTLSYFHVLEHVYDVDALLREAHRALRANGTLLIEVPDAANYGAPGCRVGAMFWLAMKEHVNHFSITSLYRFCERNGFSVQKTFLERLPMKSGKNYPSLIVIARKNGVSGSVKLERGQPFREHFFVESNATSRQLEMLALRMVTYQDVSFWGIGLEFFNLYAHAPRVWVGKRIHLIDSNPSKQGLKVDGISVCAPGEAPQEGCLICCSYMSGSEIFSSAKKLGWADLDIFQLTE